VTHHPKDGKGSAQADLPHFVQNRLPSLSEAFAATPLMQLRITTDAGSVTLVKSASDADMVAAEASAEPRRSARAQHEYIPDGEPGRAFDTVTAEVVGVFHPAPDLPAISENVQAERVLGYIEALKLRTPVKAGVAGRLAGQIAEDGQPVDFGETLFVIDSGPREVRPEESPPADNAESLIIAEPPRL